jgi:hypothetical protein
VRQGLRIGKRALPFPEAQPLDLIHTTNSPNPVSMRVPGRFRVSFQDPEGLPLGTFLELLKGPLSPLEFMLVRRYANATTKP